MYQYGIFSRQYLHVLLPHKLSALLFQNVKGRTQKMKDPMRKEINGREYIIHEMPCLASMEILTQAPIVAPSTDYKLKQDLMLKIMKFVAVDIEGREQKLVTAELVNNHVPDAETLLKLEKEVIQYSNDFLADGKISIYRGLIADFADKQITKILIRLLDALLIQGKQLSTN
jgi:hypothetical protein